MSLERVDQAGAGARSAPYKSADESFVSKAQISLGRAMHRGWASVLARVANLTRHQVPVGAEEMSCYISRASKKPTLLLLHGLSGDKSVWLPVAKHISAKYQIVIPDLPGHGENRFDPKSRYQAIDHAEKLAHLLEALDLDGVHLVGNSLGAWVAYELARITDSQVKSLTLLNPAGASGSCCSWLDLCLRQGRNPFLIETPGQFHDFCRNVMHRGPWLPPPIVRYMAHLFRERSEITKVLFKDYSSGRVSKGAESHLTAPVSIVWGEQDRIINVSALEAWKKILPGARYATWPRVGHMPMLEEPRRTAKHIEHFVSGLSSDLSRY